MLPVRAGLRLWEIILLSAVIQWGMLPLLAEDFHRVSLAGPLNNIPAVIAYRDYCAAWICDFGDGGGVGARGALAGEGA